MDSEIDRNHQRTYFVPILSVNHFVLCFASAVANCWQIIIGKWYKSDACADNNRSDTEVDVNQWYTGDSSCISDQIKWSACLAHLHTGWYTITVIVIIITITVIVIIITITVFIIIIVIIITITVKTVIMRLDWPSQTQMEQVCKSLEDA